MISYDIMIQGDTMIINLSQKERMLLEDDKSQEEICVQKYKKYAQQATDPELKQLFNSIASEEQQHFDTINQMLQGIEPDMSQGKTSKQQEQQSTQASKQVMAGNSGDKVLCGDLLSTEKFVSGVYDTGVFEAANPTVRKTLQHIQKEEQHHGEQLFNYMHSHGMYNVK